MKLECIVKSHLCKGNKKSVLHGFVMFTYSRFFLGASEAIAPLVESSQERRGGGEEGRRGGIPVLTSFLEL